MSLVFFIHTHKNGYAFEESLYAFIVDHNFMITVAQVQQPAPQFKLPAVVNGEFKDISLSDFKGKYVVFFWYPMDFTFVCPTEILAFSERVKDFEKRDTVVLAASVDSGNKITRQQRAVVVVELMMTCLYVEFSHLAWINTPRKQGGLGEMNIPILSDKTKQVARDYGVLLEDAGVTLRGTI